MINRPIACDLGRTFVENKQPIEPKTAALLALCVVSEPLAIIVQTLDRSLFTRAQSARHGRRGDGQAGLFAQSPAHQQEQRMWTLRLDTMLIIVLALLLLSGSVRVSRRFERTAQRSPDGSRGNEDVHMRAIASV